MDSRTKSTRKAMENANFQPETCSKMITSHPVVHSTVNLPASSSGLVQLLTSSPTKPVSSPILMAQFGDSKSTVHHMGASTSTSTDSSQLAITTATFPCVQNVDEFSSFDASASRVKRRKLEEKIAETKDLADMRLSIVTHHRQSLSETKISFTDHISELFYLQSGFNAMDYLQWKKKPYPEFVAYLKYNCLESDEEEVVTSLSTTVATTTTTTTTVVTTNTAVSSALATTSVTFQPKSVALQPSPVEVKVPSGCGTPVAVSTTLPAAVSQLTQGIGLIKPKGGRHGMVFGNHQPLLTNVSYSLPIFPGGTPLLLDVTGQSTVTRPSITTASSLISSVALTTTTASVKSPTSVIPTLTSTTVGSNAKMNRSVTAPPQSSPSVSSNTLPTSPSRLQTRLHSISAVYDSTIGSQEEIAERAKQEAYVMQRVAELRKEGVWSAKRLPKVQEPQRNKAHWDYLLEEMSWLSSDFSQERKWKKSSAKKLVKMCQKYHVENKMKEERAEKEVELKLKRIASVIAKEIKQFWSNVEKFVEYKQQSRLDLKRKKVLDLQLNFIVDQTEKYSTWVAEGMNKSVATDTHNSQVSSVQISGTSTPLELHSGSGSDGDFEPSEETSDDEETIAKAEQDDNQNEEDRKTELDLLEKESLVPLEELLESLPPEFLKGQSECKPSDVGKLLERGDSDFEMKSGDDCSDDESTMEAEEAAQGTVDYIAELDQLKEEGDMSIEDLVEMYKGVYDKVDSDDSTEEEGGNDDSTDDSSDEKSESMSDDSCLDIGLESLVDLPSSSAERIDSDGPTKEITDIAAAAESFKPKGYTYSTAKVAVKVPHLLKHNLREYQHIGLDWLVTMYERKLNGILADEMGLGKTIQTISLLAYLACEKGNWGPHLIVVPTSVMLNWEMEFKKWCPGFKILTYYGNPKERKQKRQGWTKPNTFHVCITSYKLVIQDHQSFRRKKWKYFILDEAQNIKNFKSQRWHLLLNFKSHRRLLLTGTPLQNSLMELWSLMHFLMPNVFLSHQDFKEWFANPVSGMIEGSHEYNKELINRLHKVLRPFLLRRLKCEVEKQLPGKYEHIVMCRLSKRQRYLYEDFMSQAKTKETLANGHYLSVINVLMQLRKVCNHPNLFESRPIVSPFQMQGVVFNSATLASTVLEHEPFKTVDLSSLNLLLVNLELCLTAFAAHRIKRFQTPKRLIEEIDDAPELPPKCPAGKIKLHVRTTSGALTPPATPRAAPTATPPPVTPLAKVVPTQSNGPGSFSSSRTIAVDQTSRLPLPQTINIATTTTTALVSASNLITSVATPTTLAVTTATGSSRPVATSYTLQLVQPSSNQSGSAFSVAQITPSSVPPITVHITQTQQGPRLSVPPGQLAQLPSGYAQLVQTATGQHILLTSSSSVASLQSNSTVQSAGFNQRMTTPNRVTVALSSASTSSPLSLQAKSSTLNSSLSDLKIDVSPSKPILRVTPMKPSTTMALSSNTTTLSPTASTLSSSANSLASRTVPDQGKPVTRQQSRTNDETKHNDLTSHNTSQFHLEALAWRKQQHRKERLERLARLNTKRCDAAPVYGSDLIEAVTVIKGDDRLQSSWKGSFRKDNYRHTNLKGWDRVSVLDEILLTPEACLEKLKNILTRFSFVVPSVIAPEITCHVSHPPPWRLLKDNIFKAKLRSELSQTATYLHPLTSSMSTQFPDARLIQYDCGKLQTLDKLLRKLKTEGRRALIFTQMKRMLDILEQFLNYHGHIYLRLDGDTKVDQRLALMERFNADRRIFCFILSTRSGGVGVNLTGADTVIFYDSDWNPTMDAQAQDRCHRIGQTRDVHVYKLISERTVEENILMKANQKRLLGEVAIEGGNFTTAYFKKITVQKLFEVNNDGIKSLCKAPVEITAKSDPNVHENVSSLFDNISNVQLENALANAEEDLDIQAAKSAKKEADLELVEFDESVPYDGDGVRDDDACKMEEELGAMMAELTPIQRYAMNFLESTQEPFSLEQLKQAEEEIEAQKKDWELGRLQVLKEEEERRAQMDDNELLFTYSREDTLNQVDKSKQSSKRGKRGRVESMKGESKLEDSGSKQDDCKSKRDDSGERMKKKSLKKKNKTISSSPPLSPISHNLSSSTKIAINGVSDLGGSSSDCGRSKRIRRPKVFRDYEDVVGISESWKKKRLSDANSDQSESSNKKVKHFAESTPKVKNPVKPKGDKLTVKLNQRKLLKPRSKVFAEDGKLANSKSENEKLGNPIVANDKEINFEDEDKGKNLNINHQNEDLVTVEQKIEDIVNVDNNEDDNVQLKNVQMQDVNIAGVSYDAEVEKIEPFEVIEMNSNFIEHTKVDFNDLIVVDANEHCVIEEVVLAEGDEEEEEIEVDVVSLLPREHDYSMLLVNTSRSPAFYQKNSDNDMVQVKVAKVKIPERRLDSHVSTVVFISANTGELMPTWAPPTPPQDDSDVYIDYSTCFLYEPTIMPESQLPPVYVRKDHKRIRMDHAVALAKKQKVKKDDSLINIPRSLFDRPSAAILKMRKDAKLQRFRTISNPSLTPYKPPVVVHKPMVEAPIDSPEWIIHEDWALLQAVQTLLELPLNLTILSPGHIPNWDLVADVVNATSRIYRSPKQCRVRYETVIIPREEGKILYDINPNKPKKSKGIYRTKNNRPMKSSQLFVQDNNSSFTQIFHQRFDTIKAVANKRMPTLRPSIVNTGNRNPKHVAVLAENNIHLEKSLTPVEIATLRQERINKEKEKQKKDAAAAVAVQNGELQSVIPQTLTGASPATTPTLTPISGLQLAARPQAATTAGQQQVLTVSQQQLGSAHPVIGQITAQQLQSVIGRIAVTTSGLAAATVTTSVRPQRAPTALVMHDLLGGNQIRSVVPQTMVSMTNATGAQTLQQVVVSASPRVTPTAVVTNIAPGSLSAQVVSSPGKSPTAAQLQLYTRNQTLYKQRLQAAQQQHQVTTITVQQQSQQPQSPQQQNKVPVSVTSLLSPNVATVQLTPSQQQQLRNQAVTRAITEAEVTQLIKRQHLQQLQQQKANAATQGATQGQVQQQLLSTAQLQQLQQQQQQQQQAAVAHAAIATGQNSFATLVKTVSTPAALGVGSASSTVTIPVGMNINVKGGVATSKNVIVAHQQQQVEQLKLQQQQILQQRKLIQQQQKLAQLTQAKTAIGTVQLVPQTSAGHKAVPTTVTVQQIQQVMKQAQSQGQQLSTITTTSNLIPGTQALPHTFLTKTGQVTIASPTTVTTALQARVVPLGQNVTAVIPSGLTQTGGSPRQTIQVVNATSHGQLRIPSTSGSTFTIDASRAQTVNVVSAPGFPLSTPTLTVTLPGNTLPAQVKDTNFDDTGSQGQ